MDYLPFELLRFFISKAGLGTGTSCACVSGLRHVRNNNREIMSLATTRKPLTVALNSFFNYFLGGGGGEGRTQTGFMHVDFALSKVCFTEYMHLDTELDYEL